MNCTDISTYLSTAEGGTLNFFGGATGNSIMFSCDYIYAIRIPSEKHNAKLLRANVLHRQTE